jgi:hypothetical protein
MDALDGMTLLINNFNGEQHRIMAEMHQEIQLLISLFIISVHQMSTFPSHLRLALVRLLRHTCVRARLHMCTRDAGRGSAHHDVFLATTESLTRRPSAEGPLD